MHLVLLPGLDGTGRLFGPLLAALPPGYTASTIAYSPTERASYDELQGRVAEMLPRDEPFVLVAESFSGPIAIRLASRAPRNLQALVLCASFAHAPRGPVIRALLRVSSRWLFAIPPPRWSIRFLLAGAGASDDLVPSCRDAIASTARSILRERLHQAIAVDVRSELRAISIPILYLQATRDRLIGPDNAERMRRIRPEMKIQAIDAPHLLLQRRPTEAMREIHGWLCVRGLARRSI